MATEKTNIIAEIQKGIYEVESKSKQDAEIIVFLPNWLTEIIDKQTQITRLPDQAMKQICDKRVLPNYQMNFVIISDVKDREENFYIIELSP